MPEHQIRQKAWLAAQLARAHAADDRRAPAVRQCVCRRSCRPHSKLASRQRSRSGRGPKHAAILGTALDGAGTADDRRIFRRHTTLTAGHCARPADACRGHPAAADSSSRASSLVVAATFGAGFITRHHAARRHATWLYASHLIATLCHDTGLITPPPSVLYTDFAARTRRCRLYGCCGRRRAAVEQLAAA